MIRWAAATAISMLPASSTEKVRSVAVCQITPTTPVAIMVALYRNDGDMVRDRRRTVAVAKMALKNMPGSTNADSHSGCPGPSLTARSTKAAMRPTASQPMARAMRFNGGAFFTWKRFESLQKEAAASDVVTICRIAMVPSAFVMFPPRCGGVRINEPNA